MEVEIQPDLERSYDIQPYEVLEFGSKTQPRGHVILHHCRCSLSKICKHHLLKVIAGFFMLVCIAQAVYIVRFHAGLRRVANDPFDNIFHDTTWDSPAIWENERQSFIHHTPVVPVHSHNDYFRRIPLFEALGSGCTSVEADVHLRGSELLIGHTSKGLESTKTLRSMYLDPLKRILEAQNMGFNNGSWRGIYDTAPEQTLTLLIDIKTSGPETFQELYVQLQPLRDLDLLTYWNGTHRIMRPLTVVGSGNTPFTSILEVNDTHRDIFFDAPLSFLWSAHDDFSSPLPRYYYNQSNSYLASTRWDHAILFPMPIYGDRPDTAAMQDMSSSQLEQAKARGLISRYWGLPQEPENLREVVWRVLVELEIGLLNMDDMGIVRARARGWGNIQASK